MAWSALFQSIVSLAGRCDIAIAVLCCVQRNLLTLSCSTTVSLEWRNVLFLWYIARSGVPSLLPFTGWKVAFPCLLNTHFPSVILEYLWKNILLGSQLQVEPCSVLFWNWHCLEYVSFWPVITKILLLVPLFFGLRTDTNFSRQEWLCLISTFYLRLYSQWTLLCRNQISQHRFFVSISFSRLLYRRFQCFYGCSDGLKLRTERAVFFCRQLLTN